tara:strand:- start:1287 stop:1550 length:264 start_codon:yes stop_codon:yes gene_type:complete
MTLSKRERYIYHVTTLMTMAKLEKRDHTKTLQFLKNIRHKGLTEKQVKKIWFDLEEEIGEVLKIANAKQKQWHRKPELSDDVKEEFK